MSNTFVLPVENFAVKSPLLLTGFFMTVLQQHFSNPANLFDTSLEDIIWQHEDNQNGITDTKIYINNLIQPKAKQSGFRPAILMKRENWTKQKMGINDQMGMSSSNYMAMWKGGHSFYCLTKSYPSCEVLTYEVATFFSVYRQQLAAAVCINNDIEAVNISAPEIIAEDNETYRAAVGVTYSCNSNWGLDNSHLNLRHLSLQLDGGAGLQSIIKNAVNS